MYDVVPTTIIVVWCCLVFNHLRSEVWLLCEQLVSICHGLVHLTTLLSSTFQSNPQCYNRGTEIKYLIFLPSIKIGMEMAVC